MPSVMKTLLLNPPSFEKFDGGAGSRWPATREIESYWYPVWLSYPAGMLPGSRLLDGPPHHIKPAEVVQIARDYEFVVVFTSTVGFLSDLRMARGMKEQKPDTKICFVGPQVHIKPAESLLASSDIDFVVRGEFDHAVVEYAQGKPLSEILSASYMKDGKIVHNPPRALLQTAELDELPFATEVYQKNLTIEKYNVPFLLNPYLSFYTSRGCPALCSFCLWPQTLSGHRWRLRSSDDVAAEVRYALDAFPDVKEIFFDDDTFNYRKSRTLDLCAKLKPLNFTWSCTSRVTTDYETLKAMKEAGCRLLIVGYESGDPQILKNIKKGATIEMALRFTENCKKLGLVIHGDFIVGLPGETHESIRKTIDYAKRLDTETIQVSIAHALPGTELHQYGAENGLINLSMGDEAGHQLPNITYPGLDEAELVDAVERFYGEYYFRLGVVWRVVRKAIFNSHERRRLAKEAREYLSLRAQRKLF